MEPGTDPDQDASSPPRKPRTRRSPRSDLDLEAAYRSLKFESRERPEEMQARLFKEERQADHERWKDKVILLATLIGLAAIGGSCLAVTMTPGPTEDKKWAMAILASIVSVGVGYLGGRGRKGE